MKKSQWAVIWSRLDILAILVILPLFGIILADRPLGLYMEFPPFMRYIFPEPFSWAVFIVLAAVVLVSVFPLVAVACKREPDQESAMARSAYSFPWWGWVAVVAGSAAWVLAWTRFPWFASFQRFTFTPLWLSYIVVVNALTFKRTGRCMMLNRPGYMLALFLLSAGFWWYFEYLNRFVQNWYYEEVRGLSPLQYILFATPPFSTVLPAVLCTFELLRDGSRHGTRLDKVRPIHIKHPHYVAWPVAVLSGIGLTCVGIWPDQLFPLLWTAPLLIATSIQCIRKEHTLFEPVSRGQWRTLYLLGVSALICGFFWEMWNVNSLAKWTYSVPYVQRFHLFEMPVLGYAGYIPFGLECAVIAQLFLHPPVFRTERSAPLGCSP